MKILQLTEVSKSFALYHSPLKRLWHRLRNRPAHDYYHALQSISLTVNAGEAVAILGQNGAGKSTLLKLIMGILVVDSGRIIQQGRVTGLLELGTGFDGELSGRDNIMINGLLIGMSQTEVLAKVDDIIAFSELGEHIERPVKTYSSGMIMRLGFSIAIHANPACFIVDEALAVGDARFQQKCIQAMQTFRQQGGALLYVSHDLNSVKMLCDRALLLHQGQLLAEGSTQSVAERYYQLLATAPQSSIEHETDDQDDIRIVDCYFVDAQGVRCQHLTPLAYYQLCVQVASQLEQSVTFGFMIKDRFGQEIFGTNSYLLEMPLQLTLGTQQICVSMPCYLGPGKYTIAASLHQGASHTQGCYHWLDHALSFEVHAWQHYPYVGLLVQPVDRICIIKDEDELTHA